MKKSFSLAAGILAFAGQAAIAQTVRYVDSNAPGNQDGASWQSAFHTLQSAISASASSDVIKIASSTVVRPPLDENDIQQLAFNVSVPLTIQGGFVGYGVELTQAQGDTFVYANGTGGTPSRTLVWGDRLDENGQPLPLTPNVFDITAASRVVLANLLVIGSGGTSALQRAINFTGGTLDVVNCRLSGKQGVGGAISASGFASLRFFGCDIVEGFAADAGGAIHATGSRSANLDLVDTVVAGIAGGASVGRGGAIAMLGITSNWYASGITGKSGVVGPAGSIAKGGGIYANAAVIRANILAEAPVPSVPTGAAPLDFTKHADRRSFVSNGHIGATYGAGIYLTDGSIMQANGFRFFDLGLRAEVTDTIVIPGRGAAIYVENSTAQLDACLFEYSFQGHCEIGCEDGGGIYLDNGMLQLRS